MRPSAHSTLIVLCVLSLSCSASECFGDKPIAAIASAERPNVVLIMADDVGYGDLSFHGNPILKTPNIDKLARQSIQLDDYHTSPYCVPTRASLMTGRYADKTGVHNLATSHWFVHQDQTLISDLFKDAGYATGMFGKWHLGDNVPYSPDCRGFDEVVRHHGGAIGTIADYWNNSYLDDTYYRNGKPEKFEGYCTDIFFNEAKKFIADSAKRKKPFFVYLPTNVAHGPNIAPPAYTKPFEDQVKGTQLPGFFGMISNLDENIGKMRVFLEELGLTENTVFVFTSDNGTSLGHTVYNAGMRGKKGSEYDGGHRLPFFLHWPNGGFDAARRISTLTATMDIAPTLVELCGLKKRSDVKFDGQSLRPLMENGDDAAWPDRVIMTDKQYKHPIKKWQTTAVMTERWRLVNRKELYDIESDPGQKRNVIKAHPAVVKKLSRAYDEIWAEIEPDLGRVALIPVGGESGEVYLNYHDCIGRKGGWYQGSLRQPQVDPIPRKEADAYWPLEVRNSGKYRIELRRWPKEADAAIHANLPAGDPVYGKTKTRGVPGVGFKATKATLVVGDETYESDVASSDKAAVFDVTLDEGSTKLAAFFSDIPGGQRLDTFYVYITKTDPLDGQAANKEQRRPNILFIIADDQSPLDLKMYNPRSTLDTPNLDALASQGMVFDGAYHMGSWSGAVCAASRHMIMCGRTVWHLPKPQRIRNPKLDGLSREELVQYTMAAVFNRAGYETMRTCKRGNSYEAANEQFTIRKDATKRGGTAEKGSAWHADQVLEYLSSREQRKTDKPFLVYYGFSHPHDTRDGTPPLLKKYGAVNHTDIHALPPANLNQPPLPINYLPAHPFHHGHPDIRDEIKVSGVWKRRDERSIRNEMGREFACSENIDIQIGRVLEKLKAIGELENTYIIYTSDHGMAIGRHGLMGKQNLYQHTWRVPLIVKGPGIKAGTRAEGNAYLLDMLATMCDLTGITPPKTNEGMSIKPVLTGKKEALRDTLYGVYCGGTKPGMRCVKKGDWKLIKYDVLDGKVRQTQLFNLKDNPHEYIQEHRDPNVAKLIGTRPNDGQTNLADDSRYAAKRKEMEAVLLEEMERYDDPYRLWDQPQSRN